MLILILASILLVSLLLMVLLVLVRALLRLSLASGATRNDVVLLEAALIVSVAPSLLPLVVLLLVFLLLITIVVLIVVIPALFVVITPSVAVIAPLEASIPSIPPLLLATFLAVLRARILISDPKVIIIGIPHLKVATLATKTTPPPLEAVGWPGVVILPSPALTASSITIPSIIVVIIPIPTSSPSPGVIPTPSSLLVPLVALLMTQIRILLKKTIIVVIQPLRLAILLPRLGLPSPVPATPFPLPLLVPEVLAVSDLVVLVPLDLLNDVAELLLQLSRFTVDPLPVHLELLLALQQVNDALLLLEDHEPESSRLLGLVVVDDVGVLHLAELAEVIDQLLALDVQGEPSDEDLSALLLAESEEIALVLLEVSDLDLDLLDHVLLVEDVLGDGLRESDGGEADPAVAFLVVDDLQLLDVADS